MTGSALFDFLIAIVALALMVGLFYIAIDKFAPDDFFKKVARWAIGGVALIVLLFALKAVLFGGGGGIAVTPMGILYFAIGILVALVVTYLLYLAVDFFAPDPFKAPVKYVIGAVVLIALLVLAANVLFGARVYDLGGRRVSEPFRPYSRTLAALPGPATKYMCGVLDGCANKVPRDGRI